MRFMVILRKEPLGLATEVKQDKHVKAPNLKKPETSD